MGAPANSGSYHLAMDTTTFGLNRNEAILSIDLSGTTGAELTFAHKDVNDEDTALPLTFVGSVNGDGVSISDDGITWHTLVSLNNANSPNNVYTSFSFDLDAAATAAGITLGSNFRIKFQQYDDFPFTTDGRTFDDVAITVPSTLSETTTAFLAADQTLTVVATPTDASVTLTATVRDPGNVVLATATASGPGGTVDLQTIGIAADGNYTVEISGDSATDYNMLLYRNATVEVVDTDDGAEQDATGSFIPLGSGRFGIVGTFDVGDGGARQDSVPVVWATQPGSGRILKINPLTGSIFGSFPAPDALSASHRINGLSIAEEGNTLLYVNGGVNGNNLYRLNPVDGTVLSIEFLPTGTTPALRGGLSFESDTTDFIFAIDDGAPVDRQAGFGGSVTDWTPSGASFPGGLGGDDNGRLFVFRNNEIEEFSTTTANTQLNAFPLPPGANSAEGLAFDGVNLYASDAGGVLYTLNPDTGTVLNQVTIPGGVLSGLGADLVASSSLLPNGGYSPPALPDLYGDPGEPGRFPNGPGAVAQPVSPDELLVNGSFETGDFTGWTTVTTGGPFRPWAVTGAGQGGGFSMLQTQPQDGAFAAWNGFDGNGPMEFQMYQDVTISAGANATLSWMDRVQWNFTLGGAATLPRLYDVEIRDPANNNILSTVYSFSTDVQAVNPTGNTNWQAHSADVSAFAGQTVRLFFREQIPQSATGPGQIEFDAISLTQDVVGETMYAGVSRGSALNPGGVLLIDQTTAAGTLLSDPITPGGLPGLDFDSAGRLWGASIDGPPGNRVSNLVEINPDTGALISSIPITRSGSPVSIGDLAIQPGTDAIYAVHSNADATAFPGGELYTIDRLTGVATVIGNANSGASGGISFTTGGRLFQTAFSAPGGFRSLNELDPSNAARISTTPLSPGVYLDGLGIRPSDGKFFAAAGGTGDQLYTIDPATGAATFLGNTSVGSPSDLAFRVEIPSGPDVDEYLLDLTGKTGQPIDIALSADVDDPGSTTLELLNTDGTTVLAAGAVVADNFSLGILDFVVPADGVYTVRVTSGVQGQYAIVVTDPLVFDTEPNQPGDSPLRSLDAYDGALGYLGEGTVGGGNVDLSLLTSFESMTLANSGFIPPDPILAAGPASVIAMVNTDMAIHDKVTGAVIAQADLDGTGGFWPTSNIVFDPYIVFDPDSGRFIAMGVDRSTAGTGSSRIYLAISTSPTPANLTTDWNKYIINRTGTHTSTGGATFPDYPKLGVNDDAIFITGNDFGIISGGFSHVSLFAIAKAPLLSGGPANIVYDEVIGGAFSIHPVTVYDAGAPMYFAESGFSGGSTIRLHAISSVLTAPARTISTVSVPGYGFPPDVPQLGGPALDSVDARIMSGVVRDGKLWTAHAVQDLSVDTETVVRWYEFDVAGFPAGAATLVQTGNVDPGPGVHTWMPNISVDNDGDMGIAFSMSGPSQYAGIGYTGRLAGDPVTTISENEVATLTGMITDPGLLDVHDVLIEWDDPNAAADSTFIVAATGTLSAGDTFNSSTDSAVLEITAIDLPNGQVRFRVGHVYVDDGPAPGNGVPVDPVNISVTIDDDDLGQGLGILSIDVTNVAPTVALDPVAMISENDTTSLSGMFTDIGSLDEHTVVIDWDDPNNASDSTFSLPVTPSLNAGDFFVSTTDAAVLTITAVDYLTGKVAFSVSDHQYLDDGIAPGNGTLVDTSTIVLTVIDDDEDGNGAGTGSDDEGLLVKNLAPQIVSVSTDATQADKAVVDQLISVSGSFTDVGTLDTHTVIVQWDDGSTSRSDLDPGDFSALDVDGGGVGSFTTTHAYSTGGIFEVNITIVDDDTGTSVSFTTEVWVSGVRLTDEGELQIIGTAGKDIVSANLVGGSSGGRNQVKVIANLDVQDASSGGSEDGLDSGADIYYFNPDDIQTVHIVLCEGDDHASLSGSDSGGDIWYVSSVIEGDGGNDHLTGGNAADVILGGEGKDKLEGRDGDDILVGGEGNDDLNGGRGSDVLSGGNGNDRLNGASGGGPGDSVGDILIGGDGSDDLQGGKGDDLLIADIWADESIVASLDALHDLWAGAGTYESKRDALVASGGLLDAGTLTNDGDSDTLRGDQGRDLFFAGPNNKVKDRKSFEDLFGIS